MMWKEGAKMVVRVAIKPVLLEWAIKRSGRSMPEIEHKFPKVQQWLAESYQPSLKQLEDFAAFCRRRRKKCCLYHFIALWILIRNPMKLA
jgi:hypothetical protein